MADDTVDQLLDDGTAPGSILVLTTGEPHPWQQHEQSFGHEPYWRQFEDGGDVFYASAFNERRLRRDVVVLVVNGFAEQGRAAEALGGALTAGRTVVVCGDLAEVRSLTGLV